MNNVSHLTAELVNSNERKTYRQIVTNFFHVPIAKFDYQRRENDSVDLS